METLETRFDDSSARHEGPQPEEFTSQRQPDGVVDAHIPKWARYKAMMAGEFPSPFRGQNDELAHQLEHFVEKIDRLRPEKGGPAYLGTKPALT